MPETSTLVSLFHTPERGNRALQDLQAAGVPANTIQTLSGASGTSAPEEALNQLRAINVPQKDLTLLSDGLKKGGTVLIVRATGADAQRAAEIFERHHAGQVDERVVNNDTSRTQHLEGEGNPLASIPVAQEELVVGKRQVATGGVRVFSRIVETPVEEQVVLQEEHAKIERHAVNRPVSEADLNMLKDRTIEVQEMAEEAVVGKTARVVEEVFVSKETTERTERVADSIRHTEVEVEPLNPTSQTAKPATTKS